MKEEVVEERYIIILELSSSFFIFDLGDDVDWFVNLLDVGEDIFINEDDILLKDLGFDVYKCLEFDLNYLVLKIIDLDLNIFDE